jgi:hypothetical protein
MTPEDEEFNRIEMESRIKQESVRLCTPHTPIAPSAKKTKKPATYGAH